MSNDDAQVAMDLVIARGVKHPMKAHYSASLREAIHWAFCKVKHADKAPPLRSGR